MRTISHHIIDGDLPTRFLNNNNNIDICLHAFHNNKKNMNKKVFKLTRSQSKNYDFQY